MLNLSKGILTDVQHDNLKINVTLLITSALHLELQPESTLPQEKNVIHINCFHVCQGYFKNAGQRIRFEKCKSGLGMRLSGKGLVLYAQDPRLHPELQHRMAKHETRQNITFYLNYQRMFMLQKMTLRRSLIPRIDFFWHYSIFFVCFCQLIFGISDLVIWSLYPLFF